MITQEQVDRGLELAIENGYSTFIKTAPARQVAVDMIRYSVTFENCTVEELIPLISDWRERH